MGAKSDVSSYLQKREKCEDTEVHGKSRQQVRSGVFIVVMQSNCNWEAMQPNANDFALQEPFVQHILMPQKCHENVMNERTARVCVVRIGFLQITFPLELVGTSFSAAPQHSTGLRDTFD